jgi:ribosome-binding factor A
MGRKGNNRITRINEEVKHELSYIIRNLKDPRVPALTSIIDIDVTTDLKHCNIYISVLGTDEEVEAAKEGLKHSSGFIRRELASRLNLRNTPELHFVMDHSIEYGIKMSKLIDDVNHPN